MKYGLVEIKCPHTKFHVIPLEACADKTFFCEEIDGKPKFKESHDCYCQVQGQLGVTKAKWCDSCRPFLPCLKKKKEKKEEEEKLCDIY